jgi:hypothetical protein
MISSDVEVATILAPLLIRPHAFSLFQISMELQPFIWEPCKKNFSFSSKELRKNVNHPRELTYLYQKFDFIAISEWFHLTDKGDIMRKISGRIRLGNP